MQNDRSTRGRRRQERSVVTPLITPRQPGDERYLDLGCLPPEREPDHAHDKAS